VLAGVHGDEPAPPIAAEAIAAWTPVRGALWVIPRVNQPALSRGTRHIPGPSARDLNREFPSSQVAAPRGDWAPTIWELVASLRPDWVLDLHEGWGFNIANSRTVGSSIVAVTSPAEREAAALREVINRTIPRADRKFTLLGPGPDGSVARAVSDRLGIPSLVVETTRIGQPIALRVEQHLLIVRELLVRLEMLPQHRSGPVVW
jgi:predicted deacylase